MMMRSKSVTGSFLESSPRLEHLSIPERFLALGDSFTIGTGTSPDRSFPAVLVGIWGEAGARVELANPAVNGYTTDDLIAEELPLVASFRPDLVTLLIGANDIVQGAPADARAGYKTNVGAGWTSSVGGGVRGVGPRS